MSTHDLMYSGADPTLSDELYVQLARHERLKRPRRGLTVVPKVVTIGIVATALALGVPTGEASHASSGVVVDEPDEAPPPIELKRFDFDGRQFTVEPPLRLEVSLEPSGVLGARFPGLGLQYVGASDRELLEQEICAEIAFLWETLAEEAPENLTESAQEVRRALRKRINVA